MQVRNVSCHESMNQGVDFNMLSDTYVYAVMVKFCHLWQLGNFLAKAKLLYLLGNTKSPDGHEHALQVSLEQGVLVRRSDPFVVPVASSHVSSSV